MIQYILNVIIVCCALILPGMAVAHGFFRKQLSKWNLPFRIVSYAIISLVVIYLFAFLLAAIPLPLFIKRIAAAFLILTSGFFLLMQRRHQHNKNRSEQDQRIPHLLFTGIILIFFAWTGWQLGILSLVKVYQSLSAILSRKLSLAIILGAIFLCAPGIYLGRVLRYNSWDLIHQPGSIFQDLFDALVFPLQTPGAGMIWMLVPFLMLTFWLQLRNHRAAWCRQLAEQLGSKMKATVK